MQNETSPPRSALVSFFVSWTVILLSVASVFLVEKEQSTKLRPSTVFDMQARYMEGMRLLAVGEQKAAISQLVESAKASATTPEDRFRVELLSAYLENRWPDTQVLEEQARAEPQLAPDIVTLTAIREKSVTDEQLKTLDEHHGWISKLAKAQQVPKGDPLQTEIKEDALRTAVVFMTFGMGGLLALLAGLVAFILIALHVARYRPSPAFVGSPPGATHVYLESFAIFLAGFLLIPAVFHHFLQDVFPRWLVYVCALSGLALGYFWPRLRGVPKLVNKHVTGLHLGRGVFREIGWGLLGWVAGLPMLALAAVLTAYLSHATGKTASHPIVESSFSAWQSVVLLYLLAAVWAPVTEELMFRGRLFPGISLRMPWWFSALLSSLVFAAIHPQGLVGIPVLMTIAFNLCLLRRWRGSLVAPMAAHAVNNASVLTMLVLASG